MRSNETDYFCLIIVICNGARSDDEGCVLVWTERVATRAGNNIRSRQKPLA